MEDVLEVYKRRLNPRCPLVTFDETSKQLIAETRQPIAAAPGRARRYDYEYERAGVANLFMMYAPLLSWRHVAVTEHRTRVDFAQCIRELVDVWFPHAKKIVLVMDNLNTHSIGSLYHAFSPDEARRLAKALEIHFTPKHGSWLNMAEIELSVLSRQALRARIPDIETLTKRVAVWESQRNSADKGINWRFTTSKARIKLKRLYPEIQT